MEPIDLVIPMVFPQDPEWQRKYRRSHGDDATHNVRWRSWGTEGLLIRCCKKYMPWVRRVHLLLAEEGQKRYIEGIEEMGWVEAVDIHYHREFIPERLLPCFNVNTIEMFLHRIPGLSECFIYSNDDLFPLSPLSRDDFFRPVADATGAVRMLPCQHHNEKPYPAHPNIFQRFVKNGLDMVASDWGMCFQGTWLKGGHSMAPMLRSTVELVCDRHANRINKSFTPGRTDRNFNQYIFPFWQHLSGRYIDHVPRRQYVGPGTPTERIAEIIRDADAGIVCFNDNEKISDWKKRAEIVRSEISRKLK